MSKPKMSVKEILKAHVNELKAGHENLLASQLYQLISDRMPKETGARWGSENADIYRAYKNGFNDCLSEVKAILKELFEVE